MSQDSFNMTWYLMLLVMIHNTAIINHSMKYIGIREKLKIPLSKVSLYPKDKTSQGIVWKILMKTNSY